MRARSPPTSRRPSLLDRSRFAKASKMCPTTNRFVLAWSEVRPFDRLRFLRGAEAAMVDLARGTKEIRSLLAMLHDFACKELELWASTEVDGVAFRDDWGSPDGLLISPEMWRDLFRPMYRDYCKILHAHDKFVFFHSNGDISDIFGDLVKLDIDAIHSQLRLMNVERLAKRYRGRVTFWGEIDCQRSSESGRGQGVSRNVAGGSQGVGFRPRRRNCPMPLEPRRSLADDRRLLRAVARPAADARLNERHGSKAVCQFLRDGFSAVCRRSKVGTVASGKKREGGRRSARYRDPLRCVAR